MQAERRSFKEAIRRSESGILPIDLKGEYIDLRPDPKLLDSETLSLFRIGSCTGTGSFENWLVISAIRNIRLSMRNPEPLMISFGRAFSATLFTQRELDFA